MSEGHYVYSEQKLKNKTASIKWIVQYQKIIYLNSLATNTRRSAELAIGKESL